MRNVLWSLVFVLFAASICSAQSVSYLPQFVVGTQAGGISWSTVIAVTNPAGLGTPPASGTITLTNDDGTPLNWSFADENFHPVGSTFQLAGGQTAFFLSPVFIGDGPLLISGFATVTSNLPVTSSAVLSESGPHGAIGEAGVPAATPLTSQATVIVKTDQENTGIAVANPGTGAVMLTFQLLDNSGTPIASQVTRTLAANNHTSFFVTDLFPSAPSKVFGTLRIMSSQPIVSTALFFRADGTFATVPTFPLQ